MKITGDFPTGSAGDITEDESGAYVILPKPEPVPDWFYEALQVNFGGAGVPREYAFHVRISSEEERSVKLRFNFTNTNGAGYMDPPYWILREGRWWQIGESDIHFVSREYCEITVFLGQAETVQIANKPYLTPGRVVVEMEELVDCYPFLSLVDIGHTAEGRPILALETEPRDETILINATMQPAEPAARPVLSIAHWLADRSALSDRLLQRFQFCLVPMPNPDGSFHGRSVTNFVGEVPMFSFGRHLAGESAPAETVALWKYALCIQPTGHIEFHTHYQDTRLHKLNPLSLEWFPVEFHERVRQTTRSLLSVNSQWRVTELAKATPIVTAGKFVNLAAHFQTIGYCYQIYSLTEEATCTQAIAAPRALARGLAGEAWCNHTADPEIVAG